MFFMVAAAAPTTTTTITTPTILFSFSLHARWIKENFPPVAWIQEVCAMAQGLE